MRRALLLLLVPQSIGCRFAFDALHDAGAATDDGIVLSLGERHSFPLEAVFGFLRADTVRDVLMQAILAAPMFTSRWRWNATAPANCWNRRASWAARRNGRRTCAPGSGSQPSPMSPSRCKARCIAGRAASRSA